MKKIVLDMTMLKFPYTGLGQFSLYLGQEILRHKPADYRYDFLLYPSKTDFFPQLAYTGKQMHLAKRLSAKNGLPYTFKKYDLWHILSQNSKCFPLHTQVPIIYTIHDLNFLKEESPQKIEKRIKKMQRQILQTTQLTAISEYVAQDIKAHFDLKEKTIQVIHNGVTIQHYPQATAPSFILDDMPFIYTVGSVTPRKNFDKLIPMMQFLPNLRLIIAGRKDDKAYIAKMEENITLLGLEGRVIITGEIEDDAKYWLYKNCYAFAFPSLLEGFGMPIIEALSMQKPVFASTFTSLPEVGGEVVKYWTDFAPEAMAEVFRQGMREIENDTQFGQKALAQAELFTWEKAGKQYLQLYQQYLQTP